MVKIVTNFENGVQIEEAPNSLRTIAPYVDVSLYGLTASGVAFYEISFVRKMFGDIVKKVIPTSLFLLKKMKKSCVIFYEKGVTRLQMLYLWKNLAGWMMN